MDMGIVNAGALPIYSEIPKGWIFFEEQDLFFFKQH